MNSPGFSYARNGLIVRLVYLCVALIDFIVQQATGRKGNVVVLCYHAVTEPQKIDFERQMRHIAGRVTSLDRTEISPGSVVITFDDAFECLNENALPVVRKLRIPIAIFAATGSVGKPPEWLAGTDHPDRLLSTMSAESLRRIAEDPMCIVGSHSVNHHRLGNLEISEIESELAISRSTLKSLLNTPCDFLALPHGSYRQDVIDVALRQGYRRVLTLDEIALPARWPPGTIGRFSASPDMWMIEFALTVRGAYAWLYPWRTWLRRHRRKFTRNCHAG